MLRLSELKQSLTAAVLVVKRHTLVMIHYLRKENPVFYQNHLKIKREIMFLLLDTLVLERQPSIPF